MPGKERRSGEREVKGLRPQYSTVRLERAVKRVWVDVGYRVSARMEGNGVEDVWGRLEFQRRPEMWCGCVALATPERNS